MENLDIISLLLRLVTGMLFFFQGYDKIFKVKIDNVARTFDDPMNPPVWPKPLLKPMIMLSSFAEMFGGIFLFFGLFKFVTLSILSFLFGQFLFPRIFIISIRFLELIFEHITMQ